MCRALALLCVAIVLVAPTPAQDAKGKAGEAADIETRAQRRMAALEETMDRLARLLEVDEPENAIRLREAYSRAREAFLSENMDKIVEFLEAQNLEGALDKHGAVSLDLQGLLAILTAGDLDDEAIRQEIERLQAIAKALGELEKEERELEGKSGEMSAEGQPTEGAMSGAAEAQGETKEKTDELAEEMKKGGENGEETPGIEETQDASGAMSDAQEQMQAGQPAAAAGSQGEAADKLAEAREAVEQQIQELQDQLQQEALADLKAMFTEMLEEQRRITGETSNVDVRLGLEEERELKRKDKVEIAKLAKDEGGLEEDSEECIDLLEEEGTAVVFPEVLEMLVLYLIEARENLEGHETGKPTHEVQVEVETMLEEMIDAFDKEITARESQGCGT